MPSQIPFRAGPMVPQCSITKSTAKPSATSNAPTPDATRMERKPPAKKREPAPAMRLATPHALPAAAIAHVCAVASRWELDSSKVALRREATDVFTPLMTSPRARPLTASPAITVAPVMNTAVVRGKRWARSPARVATPLRPRTTALTTGSSAVPTMVPKRVMLFCSNWIWLAVVSARVSYSCCMELRYFSVVETLSNAMS